MGKPQKIEVGSRVFNTKAECLNYTKDILNKYNLEEHLNENDLLYILELLKRHTDYKIKIGIGVKSIVIRKDTEWGTTRLFYIIRHDDTGTDFSYPSCVNNDTSREPLKMFKLSARSAVKDQIEKHLMNYKRTIDADGHVLCEKMGTKIKWSEAEVDHTPPLTFNSIVEKFMQTNNLEPSQVEYTGFDDNQYRKEFKDINLRGLFAEYHRSVANLRVISKQENLRQKRKNFK